MFIYLLIYLFMICLMTLPISQAVTSYGSIIVE
jgi:hypothetical protein